MRLTTIAASAALTGIGLGSLAASAVLWERAGFSLGGVARSALAFNS